MSCKILTIPCLSDNYAFALHHEQTGRTAIIDAPEAGPIITALRQAGWQADELWITHHHADHIDGTAALRDAFPDLTVVGADADAHRLPPLDRAVAAGQSFEFAGERVEVIDVSGHTVGHIAFHVPAAEAAFTADSLMALGCGRLFEGDAPMMWRSLSRLAALPPGTLICSGHEYTQANARFALTIEPGNDALRDRADRIDAARRAGEPTVPSRLDEEMATNPFLRAGLQTVKDAISMSHASDAEVFAEIRARKDRF
ncbi:hydroxyacylglutathione hydrolase [Profundibacterium mesophilum]|uniref:Hydroxyacylglutathione hydrolase n=1 Tax=Profundibacterium mesophilum KAUST100406-0324 TaxID=1037889 RepID=A0A921NX02_9RHOB|nr:hydroxyacylglutathione hydrolase [Profundibacterium mesophilum]KAF0676901.1 Hydroxyacylglutathione hydrolase [Profundibacterium mesophilum KAUST100406-0324]